MNKKESSTLALGMLVDPLLSGLNGSNLPPPLSDRFLVRHGDKWVFLKTNEIQWIEAENNYVRLHAEGGSHLLRHTMCGMLSRLDPKQFKRIHRSAIVNLDFIKELQPWSGGDLAILMRDGTRLTLSRTYHDQFAEWR